MSTEYQQNITEDQEQVETFSDSRESQSSFEDQNDSTDKVAEVEEIISEEVKEVSLLSTRQLKYQCNVFYDLLLIVSEPPPPSKKDFGFQICSTPLSEVAILIQDYFQNPL